MNEQREALDAVTLTAVYLPDCAFDNSETMFVWLSHIDGAALDALDSQWDALSKDPGAQKQLLLHAGAVEVPGWIPQRRVFSRDYETYGYAHREDAGHAVLCVRGDQLFAVSADENADALFARADRAGQKAANEHRVTILKTVATLPIETLLDGRTDVADSTDRYTFREWAAWQEVQRSGIADAVNKLFDTGQDGALCSLCPVWVKSFTSPLTIAQRASMHQLQGDDVTLLDKSFEEAVLAIRYGLTPPPLPAPVPRAAFAPSEDLPETPFVQRARPATRVSRRAN